MGAMDKVADGIYVGSLHTLSSPRDLEKNNITHIISLLRDNVKDMTLAGFTQLHVQIDDDDEEDILQYFETTNNFIQQARREGASVLVHCIAGISRSVTVVSAYLLQQALHARPSSNPQSTVESTIKSIKKYRPVANPNNSFREQLLIYLECECQVSLEKPAYKNWIKKKQADGIPLSGATLVVPNGIKNSKRAIPPKQYILAGDRNGFTSEMKSR